MSAFVCFFGSSSSSSSLSFFTSLGAMQVHIGPTSATGATNNVTLLGTTIELGSTSSIVDLLASQFEASANTLLLSAPTIQMEVCLLSSLFFSFAW